jgi:hypothetical protein
MMLWELQKEQFKDGAFYNALQGCLIIMPFSHFCDPKLSVMLQYYSVSF